jgi:adenylate kinase family enzyme
VRIAVVGTSGSGKTTLAKALATQFAIPRIELDAVNWQASWRDLSRTDPDEFVRRVALAIAAKTRVVDGNYGVVRDLVWRRATRLVWYDYERADHHVSGDQAVPGSSRSTDRNVGR